MYVPDSLKLNRYECVKIPSNKDYFSRLGKMELGADSYTGDDVAELPGSKIDTIVRGERAVDAKLQEAEEVANALNEEDSKK